MRIAPETKKTPGQLPWSPFHAADDDLRTVIQVRGVAAQLSAAAERELAQRPEALNCRLLVLHLLPPPEKKLGCTPSGGATACWAVEVRNCQSCARKHGPGVRPGRLKLPRNPSGVHSMKQTRAGAQHSDVSAFTARSGARRRGNGCRT